jgi:hypothetical protein
LDDCYQIIRPVQKVTEKLNKESERGKREGRKAWGCAERQKKYIPLQLGREDIIGAR